MLIRIFLLAFFIGAKLWAAPVITVQVDPSRSTNGDPVLFKIKIRNDNRDRVQAPVIPVFADWDILNASEASFPSTFLRDGKLSFRYEGEYNYVLKPLRKGNLRIPSIEIQIGNTTYKTDSILVSVDSLPQGAESRPRYQARPTPPPRGTSPLPDENSPYAGNNPAVPEVEEVFLRAEASKTMVYQGQLITLSYALYQADNNIANLEPAKFPSFSGFLKEELIVPKIMAKTPVEIGGRNMLRSEIIRYAIFPLKSGVISVEPMSLRAEYLHQNPRDILNQMMRGQIPQNMGGFDPIPIMKSSQELKIVAKALPPAPVNTQFTGAVGQFKIDLTGPRGTLQVDQPFNVNLTIAGSGNIKSIEEASLKLPPSIEPYQSKHSYEFREDATGFKTFEYLLLPRKAGNFTLEPISWTYFDPIKEKYVELKTPPIQLNIEAASGNSSSGEARSPKESSISTFSPVRRGVQLWRPYSEKAPVSILGSVFAAAVLALLYAALGFVFVSRKQAESLRLRFSNKPWEKTEEMIRSQREWKRSELANLSDQWIRERLTGALNLNGIHSESTRDEFFEGLRQRSHPELHRHIEQLRKIWADLDLMRFAGMQSGADKTSRENFSKVQNQLQALLKSLHL